MILVFSSGSGEVIVKSVLLDEFQCPKCGKKILVAYGKEETSAICPECNVWMRWMNRYEKRVREGSGVCAGDKAIIEKNEGSG